jgi:glycerol-3-phosphate dehydrogenase (NAD(P)+)
MNDASVTNAANVSNDANVAVIVAGTWGLALAGVLADNGRRVTIWTRNEHQAREINEAHHSKGMRLSPHIRATVSLADALSGAGAVIVAAPSAAMREVAGQMRPLVAEGTLVIHAAKGFEAATRKRMSTVLAEELPQCDPADIVALSGPSHAEEVAVRRPTTVVVAAQNLRAAEAAQDLLINSYFRVYTNPDIIGVEVGGALKNIIALGAGLSDGLGFGDNAKAALLTRGLAEMSRLGAAMGANPLTFAGLAGVGDLVVTCTSSHSRNWRAGYLLAQGKPLSDVLKEVGMVVEGVKTTEAAFALSRQYGVSMPIASELHQVLFAGKPPQAAVHDLMKRVRTHEMEETALPPA